MRRDVPRSLPYASPIDGGDAEDRVRFGDGDGDGDGDDGCLSDSQYVEEEDDHSGSTMDDTDPGTIEGLGEEDGKLQHQPQHTGKQVYKSECARLGIAPASHILSRLPSNRMSLRHALLNLASAKALSAGLSSNRCIRSLNVGSNLLGDVGAGPLLEALSGNPALTKLDLSRNLLSDRSGDALARLLSSPLCALREVVLAENFLSDCFIDVLSKDMRRLESVASSPLRSLDISSNKIRDRHKEALASILGSCSRLISLNLSWNDLRTDPKAGWSRERKRQDMRARATLARKKGRTRGVVHGGPCGPPFASAALVHPGRLITLELSFNGLADTFGVIVGGMLGANVSLSVLDLSRNHLGRSAALSIADGLKSNRGLRTLKLGWNTLGREGTLGIIGAIGENQGPLQAVRLENTTDAGLESEAAREAQSAVANRSSWVEVVCEYPDRARSRGDSHRGPVSWMTEQPPDMDRNTTYKTREEQEHEEKHGLLVADGRTPHATAAHTGGTNTLGATRAITSGRISGAMASGAAASPRPRTAAPSFSSPRVTHLRGAVNTGGGGGGGGGAGGEEEQRGPALFGPVKEAVAVPVLSVRLELRAREEARLEAERQAALEAEAEAEKLRNGPSTPSYLKPLDKRVRDKTLAEPPPRLLMVRKGRNSPGGGWNATARRRDGGALQSTRSVSTPRGSSSVPGYMQRERVTRSSVRRRRRRSARHERSTSPWGPSTNNNTRDQVARRGRSAQRRAFVALARGRSSTAADSGHRTRRSGGATTSSLEPRASKGRGSVGSMRRRSVVARGGHGSKRLGSKTGRRRGSSAASPRRPTWPSMGAIVQAAPAPSRLKLRGKEQPK